MSALNSLPLPVVRLLAFFHEELSERRPGRVPQTVQLWVGCLLVILISMTFEIPFVALSLAVLFYGIQSNAFYTKFVAILFVVATVLEIGSLFFDLQMVIRRTVDPIDHRRTDPDGLYVFDAHPSVGAGLFRRRHSRYLRANLPPPCSTIRKWSCA